MPLALVAIGQTNALLVGGFDVSVAAVVTLCVVTASFTMQQGEAWYVLFAGALALVGVGLATGVLNATLIRVLSLPSIIATLGTLSILQGISLLLRSSRGAISSEFASAMTKSVGFMPLPSSASSSSPCSGTSGCTEAMGALLGPSASTRHPPVASEPVRAGWCSWRSSSAR